MKKMKLRIIVISLFAMTVISGCSGNKDTSSDIAVVNEPSSNTESAISVENEAPALEVDEPQEDVSATDETIAEEQESIPPAVEAKFSSHETNEIGWAKGTIDRYIYSDDSSFEHYVVKMDDPEAGYGDALSGEKGVSLFIAFDLPSGKNGLSTSMVGQTVLLSANGCMCAVDTKDYTDSIFDTLTNDSRSDLWKELEYNDSFVEDGYFKIVNDGNVGKGFVEGTYTVSSGSTNTTYSGFVVDKTKGQYIKFEISNSENLIDAEILDRILDSLQIIDADYVEEE